MADSEVGTAKVPADSKGSRIELHNGHGLSLREQVGAVSMRLESEIILRALERNRWNRRRVAEVLQISHRSLLYKMKECDLRGDSETSPDGKD